MTGGALIALLLLAVVLTAIWRRRRAQLEERPRRRVERGHGSGVIQQIEAYSFPVLGAVIVLGALVYWDRWVSIAGLAIGGLFLFAGLASLREVRRRRVG